MPEVFEFHAGMFVTFVPKSRIICAISVLKVVPLFKIFYSIIFHYFRPRWYAGMSVEELDANERQAFLMWRRSLARLCLLL